MVLISSKANELSTDWQYIYRRFNDFNRFLVIHIDLLIDCDGQGILKILLTFFTSGQILKYLT